MRGQGNTIVAVLFFSIFVLSVVPLTLYIYTTANRPPAYEDVRYSSLSASLKSVAGDIVAAYNYVNRTLDIANRGGSDVNIERIVSFVTCENQRYMVDTRTSIAIPSGQDMSIPLDLPPPQLLSTCANPTIDAVYIVTEEGAIISSTIITREDIEAITRPVPVVNATVHRAISSVASAVPVPVYPAEAIWNVFLLESKEFEIYTIDNMDTPTRLLAYGDTDKGMKGGTTSTYLWRLINVYSNIGISISNQTIKNLWIGYDPRDVARYNLIITANNMTLKIGQQTLSYVEYVRIKIYGFKPSADQQGVLRLGNSWVARPSQDVASFTFVNVGLTLSGTAERVEIYKRDLVDGGTGYDPYIMLLNTDGGQGLAGILFTTIDRTYGSSSSINEGSDSLLDYSVKPIALAYKGYNISNTNHSAVVIAINYRFHDNEGSDAGGTTVDKPIMFVGLVDESGRIYSYRSFTFRELTRYEDTYPPTAQAQSSLVFIPLPPPEVGKKTFYLFVAFQDPYSYSGFLDDLDFTLFIESLSLIPID